MFFIQDVHDIIHRDPSKQLSRLVGKMKDVFEMRSQETDGSTLIYVRMKE